MLKFMEEKFQVQVENGNVLSVRLQKKLFSTGAMTIVLDGEEHDWGMKLPLFEGIASVWKYRAWVDGDVVHHVHDAGENSRMTRMMWLDQDSGHLVIDVSLEELNDLDEWRTIAHAVQRAVRCAE